MDVIGHTRIVVGVDGSELAGAALAWAVRRAVERNESLHLIHAYDLGPVNLGGPVVVPQSVFDGIAEAGAQVLAAAEFAAKAQAPDVPVSTQLVAGAPVSPLVTASETASLVVLGATGRSAIGGILAGSTAVALAAHAHSPVAIIRGQGEGNAVPQEGPVVVGVDGSALSGPAIAAAFAEASFLGARLVAVHAWLDLDYTGGAPIPVSQAEWDQIAAGEEIELAESLAGFSEDYPDVPVTRVLVRDSPRNQLLEQSESAQLVVVGSRGRGGIAGLLLGSVSQALIHRGSAPLLVVRS